MHFKRYGRIIANVYGTAQTFPKDISAVELLDWARRNHSDTVSICIDRGSNIDVIEPINTKIILGDAGKND